MNASLSRGVDSVNEQLDWMTLSLTDMTSRQQLFSIMDGRSVIDLFLPHILQISHNKFTIIAQKQSKTKV